MTERSFIRWFYLGFSFSVLFGAGYRGSGPVLGVAVGEVLAGRYGLPIKGSE